eukprot:scaffold18417_cov79-Skeletonema_dohrnii-CCMP3373.AAC.1
MATKLKESNAEHNKLLIESLDEQKEAIPKSNGSFEGVSKSRKKFTAGLMLEGTFYHLGTHPTAEEAGRYYATAKYHFCTKLKLLEHEEKVKAAVEAAAATLNAVNDGDYSHKVTNFDFFEDGRSHHDTSKDPPILVDESYFTNDKCREYYQEMNAAIDASRVKAQEIMREKIKGKGQSVSCANVLADCKSPFHSFFRNGGYHSEQELGDAVAEVVGGVGMGKSLDNFYTIPLKKREDYINNDDYANYLRAVLKKVRGRMLLFLCKNCYYCGRKIDPDYAKKYYGYSFEHPNLEDKNPTASHDRDMFELMKCVAVCVPCNLSGENKKKAGRSYPIDRFYAKKILVNVDDGDYPHQRIEDILESKTFNNFYKKAVNMGLEYTTK